MSEYINFNETSIANLKKAEDMNVNDYFLIQPQDFNNQAMILSYKNLILGLDNVSFANTITQHTTDIAQLSTATNNISSVDITGLIERCNDLQKQINNIKIQKINLPIGFVVCLGSKDPSGDENSHYTEIEVNEMFGGAWVRFAQGKMLLGSNYTGDESDSSKNYIHLERDGGEEEHTLTIDEIPAHSHKLVTTGTNLAVENTNNQIINNTDKYIAGKGNQSGASGNYYLSVDSENKTPSAGVSETVGKGEPINIMPPYIVVDMWKKISNESPTE